MRMIASFLVASAFVFAGLSTIGLVVYLGANFGEELIAVVSLLLFGLIWLTVYNY